MPEVLICPPVFKRNLIVGMPKKARQLKALLQPISMSLLIHVNSTASLLAREDTCFSEILSSLFVRIKTRSASLCLWKLKSLEQTAGLASASTDPFVKAASKVATLHHMLYWAL